MTRRSGIKDPRSAGRAIAFEGETPRTAGAIPQRQTAALSALADGNRMILGFTAPEDAHRHRRADLRLPEPCQELPNASDGLPRKRDDRVAQEQPGALRRAFRLDPDDQQALFLVRAARQGGRQANRLRSEERRVGKEGSCRWA